MSAALSRRRARGLPLLVKELAEQSARKRTYVIRTLYAVLFFAFALTMFWAEAYSNVVSPLEVLGRGRMLFEFVLGLQYFGVCLFMPAITCGVITSEKERNTIGLLLITKLRPTAILLEKLLGRAVPMASFLLLSLPLLGFAYTLGGVTPLNLLFGVTGLLLTVVQVGCLALACSAWYRTTVQSFIATYVIGAIFFFGPAIFIEAFDLRNVADMFGNLWASLWQQLFRLIGVNVDMTTYGPQFYFLFFAPVQFMEAPIRSPSYWQIIPMSAPILASSLAFFALARLFVVRRAFVPSRQWILRGLKRIDAVFHKINHNRLTRGIVLIQDATALPDDAPVAWRETRKRSLGTWRYLIRIFLVIEVPIIFLCLLLMLSDRNQSYYGRAHGDDILAGLIPTVWIFVALAVSVRSSTLISGERSHETLDVLLSTPLSASEILRQKFQGARRLMYVLAVPLLTMIGWQFMYREAMHGSLGSQFDGEHPLVYLAAALSCVFLYLPIVAWLSFLVGMLMRTQTRAIFTSLVLIVVWCVVPLFTWIFVNEVLIGHNESPFDYLAPCSPAFMIIASEFSEWDQLSDNVVPVLVMHAVTYVIILLVLRTVALYTAPDQLGRLESHQRRRPPLRDASHRTPSAAAASPADRN